MLFVSKYVNTVRSELYSISLKICGLIHLNCVITHWNSGFVHEVANESRSYFVTWLMLRRLYGQLVSGVVIVSAMWFELVTGR